jgi:outer membrane receptor protein involved in Fe transport
MKIRRMLFTCLLVALCAWVSIALVFAQSASTAALTGTVTDQTGAVVPNVTVTATNTATNQNRTVTSGADGAYRIPLLEPGQYRVRFTGMGFKTAEVTNITLSVTETVTLDRALEVGAQTEQVTVEANVETVQTATSTLGTTVTGNAITSLPLSTRNFTQVLGSSAGVAVDVANGSAFGRGTQNMSVNGASPNANNFQMDGVAINNAAGGNAAGDAGLYTGIAVPNPDALQEFKIQTSTYDASFGRNPGANVNVVTKSGTNQLHGSLFEYFRNEALNANDFFFNRDRNPLGPEKQILKQNQYGGTVGGRIIKDKLFYFGSYQGTRQRNGVATAGLTSATLYPIPLGNRGTTSLAGVDDSAAAAFRQQLQVNMCGLTAADQGTRGTLCGANALPINDVSMRLLQLKNADGSYYIPGSGTTGKVQQLFSIPAQYTEDQYLANVDYVVTEKHTLQMKYMFSNNPYVTPLSGNVPGRHLTDFRSNTSALLRLTSILSPTVVNQARISFQRVLENGVEDFTVQGYTPQAIGMKPLTSALCCNGTTGGSYTIPTPIGITGAFSIGGGGAPSFAPSNQTQYADQISWTKGAHTLRAGFEYENVRYPLTFGALGRGTLSIPSFADFLIGRAGCAPADATCSPTNPGNTTGVTSSSFSGCQFCVRSSVNGIVHNYNLHNINAFVQDDWKVSSKLTLNLGVRWEYDGQLNDKYGNLTNRWATDLLSVPLANIPQDPTVTNVNQAIVAYANNPNAFIGYVVPSNYDTRPVSQGGHGAIPAGTRIFDGNAPTHNRVPLSNFAPRFGFAWTPLSSNRLVIRGGAGLFYDRLGINQMVHAVQEGLPYADTTGIQNDIASMQSPYQDRPLQLLPRWFNFSTGIGSSFNAPTYEFVHTPLVRQYNLGIQYEFARGYVVEGAYVGSNGINIADYNHIMNTGYLACTALVTTNCVQGGGINGRTFSTNTLANSAARARYLGFLPQGFEQNSFDGVYNYNSIQTTIRKNFSHGLGFQAAYTYSKNLSNVGFVGANLNDPTNMWQQYGQTPYSRPHRFVATYQYELPFKAMGALNHLVGGWMVSGVTTIQSGTPLTLFDGRGGGVYGLVHSVFLEDNWTRAQLAPGVTYADIATSGGVEQRLGGKSGAPFFSTAAFVPPPIKGEDGSRDFGNTGVGIIRGPHQLNFDFSVSKNFRFTERQSLQFRSDFFNIFNHAQFAMPNTAGGGSGQLQVQSAQFGQILATSVNPRILQFALRYAF